MMYLFSGTVENTSLDLLVYRLRKDFLRWVWKDVQVRSAEPFNPNDTADRLIVEPGGKWDLWHGTLTQSPAKPTYDALWRFDREEGGGENEEGEGGEESKEGEVGWLILDQWRANEVNLYGLNWPLEDSTFHDLLVTWLAKYEYEHSINMQELTPEQEHEIEAADEAELVGLARLHGRPPDRHTVRAIERIESGEPEVGVKEMWRQEYFAAKHQYPDETSSGIEQLWQKNVRKKVDWEKAKQNKQAAR